MKRAHILSILAIATAALFASPASGEWYLADNVPNPFCNIPGEPDYSITTFEYGLDQDGLVQLFVLSEDGETVVRALVSAFQPAGYHSIIWDGTDNSGELLPAGDYPFVLEVYVEAGGDLLYVADNVASIYCAVATEEASWSLVKVLYRD